MDVSVSRLAVLLAVHRSGGVVAAADVLHVSPSAVSQQVRQLERECGTRLLHRHPSGATLTEAGRILTETAERIEEELLTARRELAGLDDSVPSGVVRVGAFASAVRALLLPVLVGLEQIQPGLEMVIEEVEERSALARLRRGELDMVLLERDEHTLPPAPRGMADVPLLDESWLVIVSPDQAVPTTLTDLARTTWIDLVPSTAGALALDRLERQLGTPLTTRHVADDYDVVLAMVDQGLGCALLPELAVYSGGVPEGVGVARLPGLGTRQLVIRHRSTRTEPGPATRAVMEALLNQAQSLELG